MKNRKYLQTLSIALLLIGCNSSDTNSSSKIEIPEGYTNKVINNQGFVVESQLDNYIINILSDKQEKANPQSRHKGVVVKINGKTSKTMPIEESYLGKKILIVVKDKSQKSIAVSQEIEVTDIPVIVVELNI